jgi:hypothetical protein
MLWLGPPPWWLTAVLVVSIVVLIGAAFLAVILALGALLCPAP